MCQVFGWPLLPSGQRGKRCRATVEAIERVQRVGGVRQRAVWSSQRWI